MWDGFLPQTGQLTGLKLSRCVCRPWKPGIFLFQERTASTSVCMTFQVARRKARPHGGMLFTRIRKPSLQAKRASISSIRTVGTQNRWQVLAQDTIPAICSFEKLHSNESEAAVAIGSASYANAGLFISDVSYILFSSMQSSNENDSVANFSRTQS